MADTGFISPTANDAAHWNNPDNAHASDNNNARTNNQTGSERYTTFGFSGIAGSIDGIEVKVEAHYLDSPGSVLASGLSWNAGSSYTSNKSVVFNSGSDEFKTMGGPTDTWGRTWSVTDFTDANFKAKFTQGASEQEISVDHLQVKVYYTAVTTTSTSTSSSTSTTTTSTSTTSTTSTTTTTSTSTTSTTSTTTTSTSTSSSTSTSTTTSTTTTSTSTTSTTSSSTTTTTSTSSTTTTTTTTSTTTSTTSTSTTTSSTTSSSTTITTISTTSTSTTTTTTPSNIFEPTLNLTSL